MLRKKVWRMENVAVSLFQQLEQNDMKTRIEHRDIETAQNVLKLSGAVEFKGDTNNSNLI